MKITEARIKMADGNEAVFVDGSVEALLPPGAFVAIPVADIYAAIAVADTLDRSKARKRTSKEPEPEPPTAAAPDDPPCPAHADGRHVRTGGAPCACEPARPDAVTPPAVGKTRAHRIREGVEGETGKVA